MGKDDKIRLEWVPEAYKLDNANIVQVKGTIKPMLYSLATNLLTPFFA